MNAKPFFESNGLQIHRDDFLTTGRIAAGTAAAVASQTNASEPTRRRGRAGDDGAKL
ncbi:MAG: hypothetical protein HY360_11495 [Verrucomicrobia bacterium]|nr:hypothetical protein [Verrucomicrobiota bacterium]